MRVAIVGLGAMGGYIAARLLQAGRRPVALVTRRHLEPLRSKGLRLETDGRQQAWPIAASDDAAALGPQDLVVLAMKATALPRVAPTLAPLLGPQTRIVAAMNGVPWWFFQGIDVGLAAQPLEAVDPGGCISAVLPPPRVLGCVLHLGCSMPEPGLVRHAFGNRFLIGDPLARGRADGGRARAVAEYFAGAGMDAVASTDIHADVWFKLWGNMTMNPITAMTGQPMDQVLRDPDARAFMARVMLEADAVSRRFGVVMTGTPEERFRVAEKLGAFRTSMLQDVEAGRPIELDAMVGAVIEIGARYGLDLPETRTLMSLARPFAQARGLY